MKGRVICNAGPIIAFCVIGRLDLLRRLLKMSSFQKKFTERFWKEAGSLQD